MLPLKAGDMWAFVTNHETQREITDECRNLSVQRTVYNSKENAMIASDLICCPGRQNIHRTISHKFKLYPLSWVPGKSLCDMLREGTVPCTKDCSLQKNKNSAWITKWYLEGCPPASCPSHSSPPLISNCTFSTHWPHAWISPVQCTLATMPGKLPEPKVPTSSSHSFVSRSIQQSNWTSPEPGLRAHLRNPECFYLHLLQTIQRSWKLNL